MAELDHTPAQERTEALLSSTTIGWLSTVQTDGRPHLVPVWFYWTGTQLLITTEPNSRKVANLRENSAVSFALDDSRGGHEPVLIEGYAEIETVIDAGEELGGYFEKYRTTMDAMNWPEAEARSTHSLLIRVHVARFIIF